MNIIIETHSGQVPDLRPVSLERTRFAFRRLGAVVNQARLKFSDSNGPRGGIDKNCQVQIHLEPSGMVLVNAKADNWRQALDRAIQRATQLVLRRVKLQKRPKRIAAKRIAFIGAA